MPPRTVAATAMPMCSTPFRRTTLLVSLVAAPLLAQGAPLAGSAWIAERIGARAATGPRTPTLAFGTGTLVADDGCNTLRGSVTLDGERMRTGPLASTRVACPPPVAEQATAFGTAITTAATARVVGDRLRLLDAAGKELAILVRQPTGLANSAWEVTSINNGKGAVASVIIGSTVTLVVDGAGRVTGTAGCNSYRGSVAQSGDAVTFSAVATTRKLCPEPPGVMVQERAFTTALRTAARAEFRGDRLTVRDASGAMQFTATRTARGGAAQPAPAAGPAGMGGEFTYYADAARFTDCRTGRAWPVAMEGAYIDLERAYLAANRQGRPLYVVIDGELAQRPRMEGEGTEGTIVVSRYVGAWPALACARARGTASLVNTYWRLIRLDGQPVPRPERGRREAHIILRERGGRTEVSATVGCNAMGGSATIEGERLTFGQMRSTMMACGDPLDAREQALAAALQRTRSARVVAETLELRDETGATVALFESVYLR